MCGHSVQGSGEAVLADEGTGDIVDRTHEVEDAIVAITETSRREDNRDFTMVPAVIESVLQERQSWATIWLTAVFAIFIVVAGLLIIQSPPPVALAVFPTETPIPPTPTYTPTWTPLPTETGPPTNTPTGTSTSSPSATPRPPRTHGVTSGETLFGLGLRYGVTSDSIAEANTLPAGSSIQVSQQLIIPWPTATPPLVPVEIDVGGDTIIADPTDCELYEIKGGDTFFGIAARQKVDLGALVAVNRLTDQSILQPGDRICIPRIIRGGVLPPTPGPSPTATATPPPPGPHLLYPVLEAVVEPPEGPAVLQWAAVKDLAEAEWYMVELTDLTAVDSHPQRGFTRQTSFLVPGPWRPTVPESHMIRWRVTIVRVSGQRTDGSFIYEFSGQSSQDAYFTWLGAVPTPTPTRTPTPTPVPGS
jgi:LysM repeat protein